MKYRIRMLGRAQHDLDSILAWLVARSPAGAQRWLAAFDEANQKLHADPLRYARVSENLRVVFEVRDIFFKTPRGRTYRAIFTVVDEEVRILRIRRPAQRPLRGRDLLK